MILGWDIGGVNTKVACLGDDGVLAVRSRAFELQRDPEALVGMLCEMAAELGVAPTEAFTCAVTMTAELSQMFRTKRDGVAFVLDAVSAAFPDADIRVFAIDGAFLPADEARQQPLAVAAANWSATAGSWPNVTEPRCWSISAPRPPTSFRSSMVRSSRRA